MTTVKTHGCLRDGQRSGHAPVFQQLRDYPRMLVLSEKQLAVSLRKAGLRSRSSSPIYSFSMNLVERFSPITRACLE